jgi:hypothetical protein
MYGTLVKIVAKPGVREQLLEFLRWDAAVARDEEPGDYLFIAFSDFSAPKL